MPVDFIPHVRQRIRLPILLAIFFSSTLALVGCGGGGTDGGRGGAKDEVKGKVTLNGQPVFGTVTFIGADKKELYSPISVNGEYIITNPPKGEGQFLVKGMGADIPKGNEAKGDPKVKMDKGNEPPAKYALPNNGLKVTITGGKQEYNLELTP
jgi:hypothetical protein